MHLSCTVFEIWWVIFLPQIGTHWYFTKIFGIAKLESPGYRAVLCAWQYV